MRTKTKQAAVATICVVAATAIVAAFGGYQIGYHNGQEDHWAEAWSRGYAQPCPDKETFEPVWRWEGDC